jgi:hypothetical protein
MTDFSEAYRRPCFICGQTGNCGHREPRVELAYIRAAPLPPRRPPASERSQESERKESHG